MLKPLSRLLGDKLESRFTRRIDKNTLGCLVYHLAHLFAIDADFDHQHGRDGAWANAQSR